MDPNQQQGPDFDLVEALWVENYETLVAYVHDKEPTLDAEDVVSSVFLALEQAVQHGRGPKDQAASYLYTAVRREMWRHLAYARDLSELEETHLPDQYTSSDPTLDFVASAAVRDLLASLPDEDQQLVLGVLMHERRLADVAAEQNISAATASRRLYRLKTQLRSLWIQLHVPQTRSQHAMLRQTGRVFSGVASVKARAEFWRHIEDCEECSAAVAEAFAASRSFRAGGFPLILAATGALSVGGSVTPSPSSSASLSQVETATHASIRSAIVALSAAAVICGLLAAFLVIQRPPEPQAPTDQTSSQSVPESQPQVHISPDSSQPSTQKPAPTESAPRPTSNGSTPDGVDIPCSWSARVICHSPR